MKAQDNNQDNLEEINNGETMQESVNQENIADEKTVSDNNLQEELQKEKDKFLRLFAEFENYKRRTAKERIELFSTASQDVMTALLPIIDDFDRALSQIKDEDKNQHTEGFLLIANKFKDALVNKGLKEVEIQPGDVFNADISEAITQIPAGDDMKGKVVDVVEKGYQLGEKIIRYPKVVTGQ